MHWEQRRIMTKEKCWGCFFFLLFNTNSVNICVLVTIFDKSIG